MKEMGRKLLRILLMVAMVIGLLPGMGLTAYAATETYTKLMNDKTVVKFNNYNWYIIADNSTAVDAGTVTLLAADTSFGLSKFHDSSNAYSSSTVKGVLDALTAENGAFASVKDAIADTDLSDVGVSGAKLYLLSTSEAEPYKNFNFSGAQDGGWWLRSSGDLVNNAAYVDGEYGYVYGDGDIVEQFGVRPALQLDLSRVTFDVGEKTFTVKEDVAVDSVTLNPSTAQSINVGGSVAFTATVAPDGATDKKVKWSVGGTDTGAVKLYSDGNCTTEVGTDATSTLIVYAKGISAGSATVTVTSNADSEKKASCDVTVNEAATEYPLWVGNTQVTSDNAANITGGETVTASYDPDSNTLTLNNYVSSACPDLDDWKYGICYKGTSVFTIVLKGTNTIDALEEPTSNNKTIGIFSKNSIVIKGTGSLAITARDQGVAPQGEGLIVESGTLTVTSNISYGIGGPVTIGESVTSVVVTGGNRSGDAKEVDAISGTVKNAVLGKGWTNKAGTQGEADIAVSTSGQNLSSYKKVQFPAAPLDPVASVTPYNGTSTEYTNFAEAVTAWNNAGNGATLKLLADVETTSVITFDAGYLNPMILDLNGYGICYTGTNGSVISYGDRSELKMIDSDTSSRKHYIILDSSGRGTEVSNTASEGAIEVTGGYITGGSSNTGGGVYALGAFIMEGGTIVGNTASNGGGVRIGSVGSTFTMTGGTITNNKASTGGGVYFGAACCFNLSGGTITDNVAGSGGGGVYVTGGATFKLSGGAIIKDNLKGSDKNNVYLDNGRIITVTDTLTNSASIGVTMAAPGVFTSSSDAIKASDYKNNFFSDNSAYSVMTEANELKLGTHEHSFTYTLSEDGKTIIATCTAEGCDLPVVDGKHVATLTIGSPAHTTYGDGNSAEATITDQYSIKGDAQVVYYNATKNGDAYIKTGDALGEAPTIPGDYVAEITLGTGDNTATASVGYTIAKADLTASVTQEGTLTYTGEPQTPTVATSASGKGSQTVTFTYSKTEDGPFGEMPSITNVSEAGTFYFKASAPYHNDASGSFTVSMNKKAGSISYGTGAVTKTYGNAKFTNTLTNTGDGTVTYASSDPAVATVDPSTGEVTIVKAGEATITATAADGANYTYSDTAKTASYTLTVNKATNPATVAGTATVTKGRNTVALASNVKKNGATGEVSYAIIGDAKGCSIDASGVLTSGTETGEVTVNFTVSEDANYNASAAMPIKVTITDKQTQTITVADVTATYGDTGVKVSATTDGGGTITYAVKEGSGEYIGIMSDTGALSLLKAGTGTVVVTASETATYAKATKEVTVTINKAAPTAATVTANNLIYDGNSKPLVTVMGETLGGEMQYALGTQSGDTGEYSKNIPTGTGAGTYYVWYKVVGDENHNDTEPKSVTATISYNVYNVVADNQEWTKGSSNTLTIRFKATNDDENTYTKWKQKVYVDGTEIGTANYTAKSGSLVIDLKPAYLEKLSEGKHKLSVGFNDIEGLVTANFTVKAKSSGGGSSTPEKKTDNVVTCQMAGYPANYAWNEAAKACQPGYLDANGVFHSTARKSVVPGTYDRGVAGNVISLTVSAFFAISAFFLLRKYK